MIVAREEQHREDKQMNKRYKEMDTNAEGS